MKYRHQYHAGNFADVHKHVLLLDVLAALTRKEKSLLFADTHAGRGEYHLHPGDAAHPAEWQSGAARVLSAAPRHPSLLRYRDLLLARQHGGSLHYPGSPLLALGALRAVDRAVFFETQRDEAGHLRKLVANRERTRVEPADGFAGRSPGRCSARCCGCIHAIRAPRSTARRWWWSILPIYWRRRCANGCRSCARCCAPPTTAALPGAR